MDVAIMGAGLSGLSCAIMLEKYGIEPIIFEKRGRVGDRFICGESFLSIITRPINDVIHYFSEEFQLELKPLNPMNKMIIASPHHKAVIEEQLGFINLRGRHSQSLENQLTHQIKSKIKCHSKKSYKELSQNFSHVIVATGDASYPIDMGNYTTDLSVSLKGATVEGEFDPRTSYIWLNNDIAPKGYGYLLPFSEKEANIVIAHPTLPTVTIEGQKILWDNFRSIVETDLNQSLKITDQFQVTNYQMGICKQSRIGNTFFTGNCFGTLMPFVGFGQFEAILTGIYAAYDICGIGNYTELTHDMRKRYQRSLGLRQVWEKANNDSYDFIVKHLQGFWGEILFKNSHHDPLKYLSYIARPFS